MADYLLASAGDDIKLWDIREYALVKQYNPHSGRVSSLYWAPDNSCLASASTAGDKISINYPNSPGSSFDIALDEKKTSIAFNSMSRYVMGGGTDGLVHIWDLKTRKLKMTYKDHKAAVTSIQFNWNDTMIASGSESGEIILFSVVTGIGYSPLVVPKEQAVRQVQYSHFKKSLLASASDDGAINLWDTSSKRLLHSYARSHKSPAMDLAFSPLNEMLLMSVGLDKRIVCYDVVGKCAVKTMSAESPLTSTDLMPDGATLVVGSTGGKLFIYDLRQGATPVKVLAAHSSSVQSLKFQHGAKSTKSEVGGKAKSTPSTSMVKISSLETNINAVNNNPSQSTQDIANGVTAARTLLNLDNQPRVDESNGPSPGYNYFGAQNTTSGGRDLPQDDVFSPLAESESIPRRNQSTGDSETNGVSSVTGTSGACFTTEEEKLYGFDGMINHLNDVDMKSKSTKDSAPQSIASSMTTSSSREFDLPVDDLPVRDSPDTDFHSRASSSIEHAASRPQYTDRTTEDMYSLGDASHGHSTHTSVTDRVLSTEYDKSRDFNQSRSRSTNSSKPTEVPRTTATPSVQFKTPITMPPEAGPSQGAVGGATGLTPFHTQFIRNIVEDSLEDFHDQIRQDILNLHADILKQFVVQQVEVERMVRQYSINEELLAEVERLKEENRRLKKRF